MAQLTWKNVDAPDFGRSMEGYRTFSDLINRAGQTASSAVGAYDDSISNGVNQGIRAAMQRYQDPAAMQEALTSGAFMQGVDPRRVSTDTFNAMDRRTGDLTTQNTNLYNINRTQDGDRRMDAASPAIFDYAGAAATGDTAGMQKAWQQNAEALKNLRGGQLLDTLKSVGGIANTGMGIRDDSYNQSAMRIAADIIPGIGTASDAPFLLNSSEAYKNAPAAVKLAVQRGVAGAGWGSVYGPQAGGVPSSGSENPGTSRADRNSNPGNLKAPAGTWVRSAPGFVGVDDGGFAQFDTPANGLAAMATQLNRYREGTQATGGKPVKTVEGIVGTWSPTNDTKNAPGSTTNYAKYVADKLGLKPGDEVPADKMPAMAQAMYEFESGNKGNVAASLTDAAKRATLKTPAQLNSAGANATLDAKMALSMKNLTGLSNIMAKGGDLSNPSDIATALNEKWKTIPHPVLLGEINRIAKDYEVTPAIAGEVLLNQGMGDHAGSGLFGLRYAKDFVMSDKFLGTGYAPNEERIKTLVKAVKTPMGQSRVAENNDIVAIGAAVDAAKERFTAASQDLQSRRAQAVNNPALNKSVMLAEQRYAAAEKQYQDAIFRQDDAKVAKQQFPDAAGSSKAAASPQQGVTGSWVETPQPVASTVGGNASTAIAKAITEEPAKGSPQRAAWLRQQTEARKASEATAKEAERLAKLEQERLVAERAKAYLAKTGKVLLAPQ